MNRYDADQTPDPKQWLELDEHERIGLVEDYHRAKRIKLPKSLVHAVFHVIVENQIAEELESVVRAMRRLGAEGLTRHDSIHAVASVLAEHINDLFSDKADATRSAEIYSAAVNRLTARSWRGG